MTKICPKCREVYSFVTGCDHLYKFCARCGTAIIDLPKCQCGHGLLDQEQFCPACGQFRGKINPQETTVRENGQMNFWQKIKSFLRRRK